METEGIRLVVEVIGAVILGVTAAAGLITARRNRARISAETRNVDADTVSKAFKVANEALDKVTELRKRLDAAYAIIDQVQAEYKVLQITTKEQEACINEQGRMITLLSEQVRLLGGTPITEVGKEEDNDSSNP